MAKKLSDEQCRENYLKMRDLFCSAIKDSDRFEVIYACGVDVGMTNVVVARVTTYTYASYAVGFDTRANEIVVLPIDTELSGYGTPYYLKHSEIIKAKQSFFSKEITIRDKQLPKKYIQLDVSEHINQDPDGVVLMVKQNEEAKKFSEFFKTQFKK